MGDEGGFAPDLDDSKDVLDLIVQAIRTAGYEPGADVVIAVDAAASELYDSERGRLLFSGRKPDERRRDLS